MAIITVFSPIAKKSRFTRDFRDFDWHYSLITNSKSMNAWLRNLQYKKLGRRWQTARRICAIFNSVDDHIKHVLPHTDFGRSKSHHTGNTIGSHEKKSKPEAPLWTGHGGPKKNAILPRFVSRSDVVKGDSICRLILFFSFKYVFFSLGNFAFGYYIRQRGYVFGLS